MCLCVCALGMTLGPIGSLNDYLTETLRLPKVQHLVCTHKHMQAHTHTHTHTRIHAGTYTHVQVHTRTHTHKTHTCRHTHKTHTRRKMSSHPLTCTLSSPLPTPTQNSQSSSFIVANSFLKMFSFVAPPPHIPKAVAKGVEKQQCGG